MWTKANNEEMFFSLFILFFNVNIYLVWGIFVFLIYVFLAALGLCGCARTFSRCGEQGLLWLYHAGCCLWLPSLQSAGSGSSGLAD